MGNEGPKDLILSPQTIQKDLQGMMGQLEAALPRHMNPDRMARIALTELRKNPKLFRSTRESFFGSIITASQLGLEPGVNGQCYLIPYENRRAGTVICTFVPGWKGYMDLVNRTGRAAAWTGAVHDGDKFEFEYGDRPRIVHKPGKWAGEKDALIYVYSVGRVNGSDYPVLEVWDMGKIWAHRDKFNKVGDRHYSYENPEMYARKIPLLQVIKYLPQSVELANAQALDNSAAEGKQLLTIDMAMTGALEDGGTGTDPQEGAEIERLMEQMGWEEKKRSACRDMYDGRPADMLKYVQGESEKAGKRHVGPKAATVEKPATAPASASSQPQQQAVTVQDGTASSSSGDKLDF